MVIETFKKGQITWITDGELKKGKKCNKHFKQRTLFYRHAYHTCTAKTGKTVEKGLDILDERQCVKLVN